MRRLTVRLLLVLTAVALLGEGRARGEFVDFSYRWTLKPSPVLPSGTGSVTFALDSGSATAEIGGAQPTIIPGATISTSSVATVPPDTYDTNFSLSLAVTDGQSTGDLTFTGSLSGTLTGESSSLVIKFDNPTTQKLSINGHDYTVTIGPLQIDLPAPGSQFTAVIDAMVGVVNSPGGNPEPQPTPEPSALVLGATALLGSLAARRVGRRRRSP